MPVFVTVITAFVPNPPAQLYVVPPEAVNVIVRLEQLITVDGLLIIEAVGEAFTIIVPEIVAAVQSVPILETVKLNTPDWVGVPVIVNTPAFNDVVSPNGKPTAVTFVILPTESIVILVIGLLRQIVWFVVPAAEVNVMVLLGLTVIDPVAVMILQPPVSVTV